MTSKFHAKKTIVDGITFDSAREANRWTELKILERAGVIEQLKRQVRFELIPKLPGERAAYYYADFTYLANGRLVVEDVKSPATRTPVYLLKRKLMLWRYQIRIKEVS